MPSEPPATDVGLSHILVVGPAVRAGWWAALDLGPGFRVVTGLEAGEAQRRIAAGRFDAVIAAGSSTSGLLSLVRERDPDCLRILELSDETLSMVASAVNRGVVDRLWEAGQEPALAVELLHAAVEEALLRRHNRALLDELAQRNAELLDFNTNLERLIEERTAHLREAHQRLQQQQQALLRLETHGVLTHLARGLAHELNNPLAAILGFAQRLRRHATDDETRRRLQVILDEVERCRLLVDQIRHLAAPLDEAIVVTRPEEALTRAVMRHREAARPVPDITIHGTLPAVLAAPEALARVLEEGLDNAVWAGARAVVVAGEVEHGHARLTLANDGATPDAEVAFNATKPFFTTRAASGAQGLGLALAAGLLREQDGHLELQPGRSGGAVLVITLPVPSPALGANAAAAAAAGAVLVVDDQPLVAELLVDIVQDLGFAVETAIDVTGALKRLEAGPVAAILTDLHLPDGSGQALAAAAARLRPELAGRVALITGDPDAAGKGLPVLGKPFRAEQVAHLLQ
jgi:signal transduction histidine kinase